MGDFAWVRLEDRPIGVMDRRAKRRPVSLPERRAAARPDILVETMGHINFGVQIHDRKGLPGPVKLVAVAGAAELTGWQVFPLRLDAPMLAGLKWSAGPAAGPAFWRGSFDGEKPADTFLDLRTWGKGVVWVNGHCLARFWNIGPTQTAYVPGPWLKPGRNEVIVLDLTGPRGRPCSPAWETPFSTHCIPSWSWRRNRPHPGARMRPRVNRIAAGLSFANSGWEGILVTRQRRI